MPRFNTFQKLIRLPFRLIPQDAILPILSGPSRGQKWIFWASNISYWTGTYERALARHLAQRLLPGDTFLDLGAHVGYYSLLAARKVGISGRVIAVEPLETNLRFLSRHVELNHLSGRVVILEAAVSDYSGRGNLRPSNAVAARLDAAGERVVEVMALRDLLQTLPGNGKLIVKMDIEGQELKALSSIQNYLAHAKMDIYLSTHGRDLHLACVALLGNLGYRMVPLDKPELDSAREIFAEKR